MIDILKKYINSKTYCLKFPDYHLTDRGIEVNHILVGRPYDNIRITTNQDQGVCYSDHTIPLNNKHTYTFTVSPENYNDFVNLFAYINGRCTINRHD